MTTRPPQGMLTPNAPPQQVGPGSRFIGAVATRTAVSIATNWAARTKATVPAVLANSASASEAVERATVFSRPAERLWIPLFLFALPFLEHVDPSCDSADRLGSAQCRNEIETECDAAQPLLSAVSFCEFSELNQSSEPIAAVRQYYEQAVVLLWHDARGEMEPVSLARPASGEEGRITP